MTLGSATAQIAQALQISIHTAKFHVAQIISKLEANSRAHAVAKALKAGLVEAVSRRQSARELSVCGPRQFDRFNGSKVAITLRHPHQAGPGLAW
jgi:hypothetical protein